MYKHLGEWWWGGCSKSAVLVICIVFNITTKQFLIGLFCQRPHITTEFTTLAPFTEKTHIPSYCSVSTGV